MAQPVDLVCEGGGVKGIGLAGAYAMLEERGFEARNVAGTSAGAITAALLAAGYRADDMRRIVFDLDFREFLDKGWEDRIPLGGFPTSLLKDQGIYEGDQFLDWIREQLAARGVTTFAQLRTDDDDPRWAYRLQVITSDVTARRLLVLPRDAHTLGIEPDELEVALAVRASMSIPFFFEPLRIVDGDDREHILVDGAMLSNFPVWLFDCDPGQEPEWPTFGLRLVEGQPSQTTVADRLPEPERAPRGAKGLFELLTALAFTMMEAHDRYYVEQEHWARTIPIETLGVGVTQFNLPQERKQALYDSGRRAAETFLATWDFQGYVAEFRKGRGHSRRDAIVAAMREVEV
jgi:NTE family protein